MDLEEETVTENTTCEAFEQFRDRVLRDGAVVRVLASKQFGPGYYPGVDAMCGLS